MKKLFLLQNQLPDLILLEVELQDKHGYDVVRELYQMDVLKDCIVLFLTKKSQRNDKIGMSIGDDEFIAKPFIIEELHEKILHRLQEHIFLKTQHPYSRLPNQQGLEEYLKNQTDLKQQTTLPIQFTIQHYQQFKIVYGWQAGAEVHRFVGQDIQDLIKQEDNFIAHMPDDTLLLLTTAENPAMLIDKIIKAFDEEIMMHYSFIDRDRGYMQVGDEEIPLMSLVYEIL